MSPSPLDQELLSLQACGLSNASIAELVGQTADQVAARLAELAAPPAIVVIQGPIGSSMRSSGPAPVFNRMWLAPAAEADRPKARGAPGRTMGEATRYVPVSPAKLRYARRFLAAGWPLCGRFGVAHLFDLDPEDLAEAVGVAAPALNT